MRAHSFPGLAALSAFTLRTKRSRSVGASKALASSSYIRAIDSRARRKTRRTASLGEGIGVGFIGDGRAVVHASTVSFF